MISVIIPTADSAGMLMRCFDSLITATVRGVVREVIVSDSGSGDGTLAIAHAAGAHMVHCRSRNQAGQLNEGAEIAKSDWLLFLHPQTALEPGWEIEAQSFIDQEVRERPRAAVFRFALEDFGGRARRAEAKAALRTALLALAYGDQGLLIPKRFFQSLGGYRAFKDMEDADLVRRIGRRRLVRLRSRALNVARSQAKGWRGLLLSLLYTLRLPSRLLANL